MARRRVGLGAFDVDHLLAVDLTRACRRWGPGPSDTNGTVTTASNTPKTTIGTSATIKVRIRLFTPLRLDGPRQDSFSHKHVPKIALSVLALSTVDLMADLPFGFSSGDDT